MKTRAPWAWVGLWLVGLGVESWALKNKRRELTLSHATRRVMRTDTIAGRVAFIGGWCLLTKWFVPHIVNHKESL